MKSFSEICEDKILDGDKIKIDTILNEEIVIYAFRIRDSKFSDNKSGDYMTIQFSLEDGIKKIIFTGSEVLIEQIVKYKEELPFKAKIRKINKYYTLT